METENENKSNKESRELKKQSREVTYTADEFAAAAEKLMGTTPDIVYAAFLHAGITEATKKDGISLVKKYLAQPF